MILLLDMDAFFASVEQKDNPILYKKPVVVSGRIPWRSVVSSASYEARKFGICSAMPLYEAKKRCSQLVVMPPRINRYKDVSKHVVKILKKYSSLVETVSIDESYVDLVGSYKENDPIQIVLDIQHKIYQFLGLTCSIGIAPVKFLAKIASTINKPNGIFEIKQHEVKKFIEKLSIQRVPGVGKKTEIILLGLGIRTLSDVKKVPFLLLKKKIGNFAFKLFDMSNGKDRTKVTSKHQIKSISSENTLFLDTKDKIFLERQLFHQSEIIGSRLRRKGLYAKNLNLKIKYSDFTQFTQSKIFPYSTNSSRIIFQEAKNILNETLLSDLVRLIGIATSKLTKMQNYSQIGLFENEYFIKNRKWIILDKAIDNINFRIGKRILARAMFFSEDIGNISFIKNKYRGKR